MAWRKVGRSFDDVLPVLKAEVLVDAIPAGIATGIVTRKVLPWPGWLFTSIEPFSSSTSRMQNQW